MKITRLVLWVQENTLSEKFYKKLGFSVEASDDEHTVVALDGFELDLVAMRDEALFAGDSMSSSKGKGIYIYVQVDDVGQTYHALQKRGIQPATEPRDWQWGNREFIVKDPDGYKLCFWQPLARAR